ncbi:MAG: DUF3443 domain-containing protein [Acidobacteria bacterium]|nr:DUF3443 domain-containing protein [Acidobacteriota bacterium]
MPASKHFLRALPPAALVAAAALMFSGCGSGSSSSISGNSSSQPSTGQNIVPIVVDGGPAGSLQSDIAYVSVTVCVPRTSNCQTIDHVQVDTGSEGLRLISGVLALPLPQENDAAGNALEECAQFVAGYTWGPVQFADIQIGGEKAAGVPIQVIGGGSVTSAPQSCTNTGLTAQQTADALGANGVLGIGPFRQDCGGACTLTGSSNPGFYFSCSSSACSQTEAALNQQLQNPVWMFPGDNNGSILELPAISTEGAATVTGTLVFGIGTQSNNGLGSATVFTLDATGNFTTQFHGSAYSQSYIDSGSNGIFFLNTAATGLPECPAPNTGFYCPAALATFTATNVGANGSRNDVNFSIANASTLNSLYTAFNDLGGASPGAFDWGLPFFFGRNVFTAIEGQSTPGGTGPYFAY